MVFCTVSLHHLSLTSDRMWLLPKLTRISAVATLLFRLLLICRMAVRHVQTLALTHYVLDHVGHTC
jgi:hypothetical protein